MGIVWLEGAPWLLLLLSPDAIRLTQYMLSRCRGSRSASLLGTTLPYLKQNKTNPHHHKKWLLFAPQCTENGHTSEKENGYQQALIDEQRKPKKVYFSKGGLVLYKVTDLCNAPELNSHRARVPLGSRKQVHEQPLTNTTPFDRAVLWSLCLCSASDGCLMLCGLPVGHPPDPAHLLERVCLLCPLLGTTPHHLLLTS